MKILRKYLLPLIIENKFSLTPAVVYSPQQGVVLRKRKRFTLPLLKPIVMTFTLVIAGLMFSNIALANRTSAALNTSMGTQSATPTYGTSSSASYTITVTTANHTGTQTTDALTITGLPTGATVVYSTGATYTPTAGLTTITVTITTSTATPAGSYAISVKNTDNNGGANTTATGTLNVSKLAITVASLTGANKVYDGTTTASTTGTATLSGLVAGDAGSVTLGGTPNDVFASKNVGTNIAITVTGYTIGGAKAADYTLTQPTGLKANITVKNLTITASTVNKTYGTGLSSGSVTTGFTAPALATGDAIASLTMTYGTGALATANVGTYTGTAVPTAATGANFIATNYNITYTNGNIVCGAAAITIKASNQTKTYGNTFTFTGNEYTISVGSLKNSDAITSVSFACAGSVSTATVAGSPYTITPSGATGSGLSNYTIAYTTGTMTLTGIAITITATGPTPHYYGTTITTINNATNFTVTGTLVTGQSITTVTLTGDGNAQNAYQAAGSSYHVTPSNAAGTGFVASNYNITYVAYAGTISPAPITITATGPTSKVYGTALTTQTNTNNNFTESGTMAPGEVIEYVTLTPSGAGVAANAPAGSSYTITPSAALDYFTFFGFPLFPVSTSNYTITYVGFTTGSVTPAPLTITANAVSKAVGVTLTGGPGSTAFTSSGLVGTETIGSVTISYGAAAAAGAAVGVYTNQVTPSVATGGTFLASNYTITYKSNTLTVVSGIYDWTGTVSADWATPQNWNINGVQQTTTYPGLNVATDVVQVGVVAFISGNQPTLSATPPFAIASINFGPATTPSTVNLSASADLSVTGNLTLNTGAEVVNLNGASGSALNIGGDYVTHTGSTFNNNSAATITVSGLFTNSGTSNFGTALLTFTNASSTAVFNTSTSQLFTNVLFTGGGNITLNHSATAGQFSIASTGVITLGNNETLAVGSASLTLLSDANGSATAATLPSGASITGNVSVQRYLQAFRGYRLVSSPVYASSVGGNNVYSINYLKGSAPLTGTGGTAGGLDKAGNPTLYLYRENLAPQYTTFLNSNFRGINNISASPTYGMDDTTYASVNIPVGNGYLFYFRGSLHQATLATLTTAGATATNDTLTTTGVLNQGTITVANWYTPGSSNLGFTTVSDTVSVEGSNLVGNPYASSIDWDQSDSTNTAAPIYAPHVAPFTYQLILSGQGAGNYDVYQAGTGGAGTVNTTNSNIIPSGEGFFVFATNASASLTFTEAAKTTAQVTGTNLYMGKPPVAANNQFIRLKMALDSVNTDGTIIRFNSNTKSGFNPFEDARYRPGTGKASLSSLSSDNVPLAINQLPLTAKTVTIPLNVTGLANKTYTLSMTAAQGIPLLYDIWLKDAFTKDSVNMRSAPVYTFGLTTDVASYGAGRLSITMRVNPLNVYQLLTFNAQKQGNNAVQVTWTAQNEANYTNFAVERSNDGGKTYNVIGSVTSSGLGSYGLLDPHPMMGENIYRLLSTDYNNTVTYSNTIDVLFNQNGSSGNISCYPNPAVNAISISIMPKSQGNATFDIRVTNSTGLTVRHTTLSGTSWQGNVNDLLPGTYLVQVTDSKTNEFVGQIKFVKL